MHWQPEDESPAEGPTAARLPTSSLNPPGGGRELESGEPSGGQRLKRDEAESATPSRISSPG